MFRVIPTHMSRFQSFLDRSSSVHTVRWPATAIGLACTLPFYSLYHLQHAHRVITFGKILSDKYVGNLFQAFPKFHAHMADNYDKRYDGVEKALGMLKVMIDVWI